MRYDKKVALIRNGSEEFNEETGDWDVTEATETDVWANVSDTGEQRQSLIYGGVKQGALTVRMQGQPPIFTFMRIDGAEYEVTMTKRFRRQTVFQVVAK